MPLPAWVSGEKVARGAAACTRRRARIRAARRRVRAALAAAGLSRGSSFPIRCSASACRQRHDDLRDRRGAVWHLGDDIAIVSFKTKAAHDQRRRARRRAARARRSRAQIRGPRDLADERAVLARRQPRGDRAGRSRPATWAAIEAVVAKFQQTAMRLRYSLVPTVCGGARHGARRRVRVHHALRLARSRRSSPTSAWSRPASGLLPAGGGCKEFALRAAEEVRRGAERQPDRPVPVHSHVLPDGRDGDRRQERAGGEGARLSARRRHRRDESRTSCCTSRRRRRARWPKPGYRPPLPARDIPVAGQDGHRDADNDARQHARRRLHQRVRLRDRARASRACCAAAKSKAGSLVDEEWLLELERSEFMELLSDEKTQARIAHTLKTGKPLRN